MVEVVELLPALAAFLCVPLCVAAFAWYAVRARRAGSGQTLMAPFDELYDPATHKTNVEIQVEARRAPETPAPGDLP
jgi:hypothetical protein